MLVRSSILVAWTLGSHSQHRIPSNRLFITACHESRHAEIWRDSWQETKPFVAVEKVMDHVLSANNNEAANLNFELVDQDQGEGHVPDIFLCFYRGQLADFVDLSVPSNRKHRTRSFRLDLAYRGTDFCGWQTQDKHANRQLALPAVQDLVQAALDNRDVRVAGRTDAGVHAVGQVARVRCDQSVTTDELQEQLRQASARSGSWTCRRVMPVNHSFHPTFGATSRSYIYLVDANDELERRLGPVENLTVRLNLLLKPLVGETLPYLAFSYGRLKTKTSNCTLSHARARYLKLDNQPVLAVELTGDRFLRRMVRILVASAIRLAACTTCDQSFDSLSLFNLVETQDRRQAALPAPSQGLIFVTASYG